MAPCRPIAAALLLALGLPTASARADEVENYRRLQAMPRERRVDLAENLERFDKLGPAERAAIRKLDARIAAKDPVDQARYRAVLRRYHLWVNGLADEQKQALLAAESPDARFALARKFRGQEADPSKAGPRVAGIRTGDFGIAAPFEVAHMLRIWEKLPPARRAEIEKQQEHGRLYAAIRAEARSTGVKPEPFPAAAEAAYSARLEGDPELKQLVGGMVRFPDPAAKKADPTARKGDALKGLRPLAEFLYFEDNRPRPVAPKDLERFSAACPPWLHAMTDPLSSDDARDYLTVLYRLLYPHPSEMPAAPKAGKAPAPASGGPRPAPKKAAVPPGPQ